MLTKFNCKAIKRIAIFRRNGLGDVLCAIPLVLRCKELMPQAKIHLFIEKRSFPLVPYLEGPDEVAMIPSQRNKYFEIVKLAWQWRNIKFDLALSAKTSPMRLMNAFLLALRAKTRIAYVDNRWDARLVNYSIPYDHQKPVHQALQAIHLIDPSMDILEEKYYPVLKRVGKKTFFPNTTVLISVSNNRIGSTLPIDRYASILNTFFLERPFSVAISSLSKDYSRAKELAILLKMENKVFLTEIFDDFLILINSVDLVFVGDGGIVHLAAALQKKSVVLYGGTNLDKWGPLNKHALSLSHPHHIADIPQSKIIAALSKQLPCAQEIRI